MMNLLMSADFDHTTGPVPPNLAVIRRPLYSLPFKSQTLVNPCYDPPASHRSSHLERQLRKRPTITTRACWLNTTSQHGRPDPMGPSNLFPDVFEHCEMASQVPKRVIIFFW